MSDKSLVEMEKVRARNPITNEIETVQIEKPVEKTPEEVALVIKAKLAELGLEPVQEVEVEDPLTGRKMIITIDRTGHNEQKLIVALADPNMDRDQKDHMLSMYLFERGKESASFISDIMRYKGAHTKESRVFQSRMRFDFESFADSFTRYLHNQSKLLGVSLGIDIEKEKDEFKAWVAEMREQESEPKEYHYWDFVKAGESSQVIIKNLERVALVELAMFAEDEAVSLKRGIDNITKARMAQKGFGIYINSSGQPYSINDKELDEIIKQDRELINRAHEETYAK